MKKSISVLIVFIFVIGTATAQDTEADKSAIKETTLNYIEGWYEGNPERMEKALHSDLTKRGVQVLPQTGNTILGYASKSNMVEYTRAGFGKLPPEERNIQVKILDIDGNMASVKAISVKFIDYIQMAKCDGKWLIVNVLWEPVPKKGS